MHDPNDVPDNTSGARDDAPMEMKFPEAIVRHNGRRKADPRWEGPGAVGVEEPVSAPGCDGITPGNGDRKKKLHRPRQIGFGVQLTVCETKQQRQREPRLLPGQAVMRRMAAQLAA